METFCSDLSSTKERSKSKPRENMVAKIQGDQACIELNLNYCYNLYKSQDPLSKINT